MRTIKIIIEKHEDGYVSYPIGLKGVIAGQGDTYGEALSDIKSAIEFHVETFGDEVLDDSQSSVREAFLTETRIAV